jgi:hypothetical protein
MKKKLFGCEFQKNQNKKVLVPLRCVLEKSVFMGGQLALFFTLPPPPPNDFMPPQPKKIPFRKKQKKGHDIL